MPPRRVRWIGRTLSALVAHAPWLWGAIRSPVQRFWDRMAGGWDANESPHRTQSMMAALEQVGEPTRILEIGAGTGSGAALLRRTFPDAQITAVDLSPEMVRIATTKVDGVTFEPADASRLPFPDASFDLVTQNNVPVYFKEIDRVLAPGGRVLIASTFGPATPYYTPHGLLRRRFERLGFSVRAAQAADPGDFFIACRG